MRQDCMLAVHALLHDALPQNAYCNLVQGYVDAAEVFHKESDTKPGVDLAAITDRMQIRKAVQSGDIQQAIERVNDLNPEVRCNMRHR